LGELFMESNQPALAFPEFEAVLTRSPKRFNATYGAARSAQLSGDRNKANARYAELLQLCSHADTQRLEVQNARAYLEKR
jgi:carbohydrate-selective porin OprB